MNNVQWIGESQGWPNRAGAMVMLASTVATLRGSPASHAMVASTASASQNAG